MAGRTRRFSSTSVDEGEVHGHRIKYIAETHVLKAVPRSVIDPNEWPCYVLEDTTIHMQDRKTIGNLLNAELQGSCVVRGRLSVDGDLRNHLIHKKFNGQYIEIANCDTFSIAADPITLWALGKSGWLEIRPSEKYQKMYDRMVEATSIYFFVLGLYEKAKGKKRKDTLSIDAILLKYGIYDGTGLVRSEAADRIKSHSQFLLSQMRKEYELWKSTIFFEWLSAESIHIYAKLMKKYGETIFPPSPIPLAILPTPVPQLAPPPEPPKSHKTKILPHHSRDRNQPGTRSTPILVLPSESSSQASSHTPSTSSLPETSDPLTAILALMHSPKLNIRGWAPIPRMTLSKLGTLFLYTYTIKSAPVSQEIIKIHAASIISSLGPEWKVAPVYAQLKEASSNPTTNGDVRTQAMAVTEVKRRGGKVNTSISGISGGRPSKHDNGVERGTEGHGSKSLFPPQGGRRSGKEAGLRLASSPAMKRSADAESSDDGSSRPRKKRRPSPPEMGDDSDTTAPPILTNSYPLAASDAESDDEEDDDLSLADTKPLTLRIVSEALPTLSPSGPNGTWKCDDEGCFFIVRDAESEDGKETIRKHFNDHADRLEREALARQEAAQRRLPIDYLLEKLRALGESSRLGQMGGTIDGRVIPEPIKRPRGMAVWE